MRGGRLTRTAGGGRVAAAPFSRRARPMSFRRLAAVCVLAVFAGPAASGESGEATTDEGFVSLFDGETLAGWRNPFEHGHAEVVDGEILLTADKKFFLVTDEQYRDFVLVAEIHLPEGKANSGVMFRCHVEPNRVYGYQAECDGSDRRWSAGLYDEGRRGWVWPSKAGRTKVPEMLAYEAESQAHFRKPEVRGALDRDGWNRYVITCKGDHITIELNGVTVTDVRDATDAEGFIGIQHHGEEGQTYRFRNISIKPPGGDA